MICFSPEDPYSLKGYKTLSLCWFKTIYIQSLSVNRMSLYIMAISVYFKIYIERKHIYPLPHTLSFQPFINRLDLCFSSDFKDRWREANNYILSGKQDVESVNGNGWGVWNPSYLGSGQLTNLYTWRGEFLRVETHFKLCKSPLWHLAKSPPSKASTDSFEFVTQDKGNINTICAHWSPPQIEKKSWASKD